MSLLFLVPCLQKKKKKKGNFQESVGKSCELIR